MEQSCSLHCLYTNAVLQIVFLHSQRTSQIGQQYSLKHAISLYDMVIVSLLLDSDLFLVNFHLFHQKITSNTNVILLFMRVRNRWLK